MQTTRHYWQPRRLGHANLFIGDYEPYGLVGWDPAP